MKKNLVETSGVPALPGSQTFEENLASQHVVKQKRALVVAYADLIVRCRDSEDRSLELKVIQSLEKMVLADVKTTGQARAIAEELEQTGERIWSLRNDKSDGDGSAHH